MLCAERLESRYLLSAQASPLQSVMVVFDNATSATTDLYLTIVDQTQAYQVDAKSGLVSPAQNPTDGYVTSYKLTGSTPDVPTNLDGKPFITLQARDDQGALQSIVSGRFYLSSTADAVAMGTTGAPGTISPTASFTYDLVEFTLNGSDAPYSLNLDLSQIDQFGMPITITLDPPDANFPDGAGVLTTLSRADILEQFTTYANEPAFAAYAGVVQSSPSRLLGPHHLIDQLTAAAAPLNNQEYAGTITAATSVTGGYEATFTITGTWLKPIPPQNTALTTSFQARGESLPAGTSVKAVSTSNVYEVTLFSENEISNATDVLLSFFVPPATPLVTTFDTAILDLFQAFRTPTHILATPGRIYEGKLRQDFAVPSINDTDSNTTNYTVIEFTELGSFSDETSTITPPTNAAQKYQVFYPYFTTNTTSSPNDNALTPSGVPAPPKWWKPGYLLGGGQLDWLTSPSQMVFACDGIFADDVYQQQYFVTEKKVTNWDHAVLGDIENQLSSWLNRGVSPTTNLENRVGFLSGVNLVSVDLSKKASGTTGYLAPSSTNAAQVFYAPSQLTTPLPTPPLGGWGVVWPTLTGTLKLNGTEIQNFTVNFDKSLNALSFEFQTLDGTAANLAQSGLIQFDSAGVENIYIVMQSDVAVEQLTIDFAFDYGPATTEARYGIVSLLAPPSGWTDTATGTLGIEVGMEMIAFSQFKTPMEVYEVNQTAGTVTVYAPTGLQSFNTNVLQFADFYPVDSSGTPVGSWNAYSGFWHEGDRKNNVTAPTIAARSYAFPFDDDGGYSSDINLTWQSTSLQQVGMVTIDLLAFGGSTPTIISGDFDGDGLTDIASRDTKSGLWKATLTPGNPADSPTTVPMKTWSTKHTWSDITVGDFNGDGKDDIAGRVDSTGAWWLLADEGSGYKSTLMGKWDPKVAWVDVVVGNFDGDQKGQSDLAGRTPTGMWWMLHYDGTKFTNQKLALWSNTVTWSDIVVGNFNGAADGRDEIAGRSSQGTWWMLTYDDATWKNQRLGGWSTQQQWVDVVAGRFDSSGRDTIAGRTAADVWWLLSYDATLAKFKNVKMGPWSGLASGWASVVRGDFDGNGFDDVAGRSLNTGAWTVTGMVDGSFQTSSFAGSWPTSSVWLLAFSGLYDTASIGPPKTTGILGRSEAGTWVRSLSNGDSFTTSTVTGYP